MSQEAHLSPQLLLEKQRRTRWWIIVGVCLVLAIPGAFLVKFGYVAGKGWRARQLAQQAEDLLRQDKFEDAAAKARSAYQLKIDEPAAIRAVAHLESAGGRPGDALAFWNQLEQKKALTPADRRSRAEDLFRSGLLGEAETANTELLALEPGEPANLRLAARIAVAKGNREAATEAARRALLIDPDNLDGKLLLALLQSESPDAAARQEALQSLLEMMPDRGKYGLAALVALANRRDLSPEQVQNVASLLREHPQASDSQRFLGLDLEIRGRPDSRVEILDRTAEEFREAEPARRRALGVWLNTHGEWERTLALIPLAQAIQRKDLLLVHLDALAALKRWKEIQKILEGKSVPLDPVYKELFLARSAMELGQTTVASLHWTQAHTEAAASIEQMWFVGKYAEQIGQTDQAERAYESLKSNATSARAAYEALLHLAERERDTVTQRSLLKEMRERWPKDAAVANDYLYLNLLARATVPDAVKIARQLVTDAPSSLPHRTTLALALVRQKDFEGALKVYSDLRVNWDQASSSARAVHAAVVGLSGQEAEARREAALIRPADLREEERELLKPWAGT